MAYLINRNPPARPQCLHALCQLTKEKFSYPEEIFRMKDIKFDPNTENIHKFCKNLKKHSSMPLVYCPYKENSLDEGGCALTNGKEVDSTKQKDVSNTINALHSIGFFERQRKNIKITKLGIRFAECETESKSFTEIFKEGILKNGLMVGLLGQIYLDGKKHFSTKDIYVGYPNTGNEYHYSNGEKIMISCGSVPDSNTRTKSCLLAWGTAVGFFYPTELKSLKQRNNYVMQKSRLKTKYEIGELPNYIFEKDFFTDKPLDYNNLTKNTGALREHNQKKIREITLEVEPIIKNRRLAILHALNNSYKKKINLDLFKLINSLEKYPEHFVINQNSFKDIMLEEIKIGLVAGIPYEGEHYNSIKPLCGLNIKELNIGAPEKIIQLIEEILK